MLQRPGNPSQTRQETDPNCAPTSQDGVGGGGKDMQGRQSGTKQLHRGNALKLTPLRHPSPSRPRSQPSRPSPYSQGSSSPCRGAQRRQTRRWVPHYPQRRHRRRSRLYHQHCRLPHRSTSCFKCPVRSYSLWIQQDFYSKSAASTIIALLRHLSFIQYPLCDSG